MTPEEHQRLKQQEVEQEQAEKSSLQMAGAYEEMIHSKGWENLKVYYQSQISSFINAVITQDKKKIEEFEGARNELIGMKKLFGHVQSSLDYLESYRKNNAEPTTTE